MTIEYRTTQDIVIPAGTKVSVEPKGMTKRLGVDHASIITGPDKDSHAEWLMDLEEAIRVGLVEEVPDE